MKVLVAHASRYGATQAIAERIAEKLTEAGAGRQSMPRVTEGDSRRT
jgi:menaquinone-dependent protoporphyrinogen oxidase